jgi:hypothetical protein
MVVYLVREAPGGITRGESHASHPTIRRRCPVTRCLILARQSVADEEGRDSLSLASQEAELRARAAREGWRVVAAVREPGVKGWAELSDRPGLSE